MDAINREMENLKVTFYVLEDGFKIPVGYNKVSGHLFYDVHMKLELKARWVKDRNRTIEPEYSSFSEVLSRESARIVLICSALKELPICTCDIQNAHL